MRFNTLIHKLFVGGLTTTVLAFEYPAVYSGNYAIIGCGSKTDSVVTLLQQLWSGLPTALKTSNSNPAYSAFFSDADPSFVNTILTNIALGTNVIIGRHTRVPQAWQPAIVCMNTKMPELNSLWPHCNMPRVRAMSNGRYVYLCPQFFNQKSIPTSTGCSGPQPNNMVSTGQGLMLTQLSALIHELVHLYLEPTPSLYPEVYEIWDVLRLPASKSVINPQNYGFYIANIIARCTVFDAIKSAMPPERKLLFDDTETGSVDNGTDAFDQVLTPSASCTADHVEVGSEDCLGLPANVTFQSVSNITNGSLPGVPASPASSPPPAR